MYVFDSPPLCCFVLQEPAWSAALPAAHLRVAALPMPMGHGQEVHGCLVLGGHLTTRGKSGRAITQKKHEKAMESSQKHGEEHKEEKKAHTIKN